LNAVGSSQFGNRERHTNKDQLETALAQPGAPLIDYITLGRRTLAPSA
jgi:hypothetical protein